MTNANEQPDLRDPFIKAQAEIGACLLSRGELTVADLQLELSMRRQTVFKGLRALETTGLVYRRSRLKVKRRKAKVENDLGARRRMSLFSAFWEPIKEINRDGSGSGRVKSNS